MFTPGEDLDRDFLPPVGQNLERQVGHGVNHGLDALDRHDRGRVLVQAVDELPALLDKLHRLVPRLRLEEALNSDVDECDLSAEFPELRVGQGGFELRAEADATQDFRMGPVAVVVERTFAWLSQFRRLRVRYDKRADIHEAFLSLGCALICWQSLRKTWRTA